VYIYIYTNIYKLFLKIKYYINICRKWGKNGKGFIIKISKREPRELKKTEDGAKTLQ